MKMIDIHAHTTNNKLWDLHVPTATLDDLEQAAEKYGLKRIVLMATYFPFKKGGLPNRILLERIKNRKLFLPFGSLDAMNYFNEGVIELDELAGKGMIAGIKLYPGYQDFDFGAKKAYPIYEIAQRYGLPVMFHSGELHSCCPKSERSKGEFKCKGRCRIKELGDLARPGRLARIFKDFPSVIFIVSHLANPYFEELREVMAGCRNVHTDISGQYVSGTSEETDTYKKEVMDEIRKFLILPDGEDRILFGSDFPIQSYANSIALITGLGLSPETEEKIFYANAAKILKL